LLILILPLQNFSSDPKGMMLEEPYDHFWDDLQKGHPPREVFTHQKFFKNKLCPEM
jgi:hypothetical protein